MKKGTFKGGIHLCDCKKPTDNKPAVMYLPKGELVFHLSQHIGAPAVPVVQAGDKVLMGQLIARAEGAVSANVISSASGTVCAIEPRRAANGSISDAIVIQNDGSYTPVEGLGVSRDYKTMSKDDILDAVKAAGIVGLGGAGFPTHVKLMLKNPDGIEYIIVNAAECEPYLTSDYRAIMEHTELLIGGLRVVLSLFPNAKAVIGIEDNKPEASALLRQRLSDESDMTVALLITKYPQGGERNLIYAITKREIHSKLLPADVGCLVLNANTVIAINNAVCQTTPLMEKVITVTGRGAVNPCNIRTKIGTSFAEVLQAAGGAVDGVKKIVSGGPMMGEAMLSLDVPVAKTSASILCMTEEEAEEFEPGSCIRCGSCVRACPVLLAPVLLADCAEKGNARGFVHHYGLECYECGCCSYVCPARLHLTATIKQFKQTAKMYLKNKTAQEVKQ